MTFDYSSTFDDYKAAQKLYLAHNRQARVRFLAWMYGLPIVTVLLVAGAVMSLRQPDSSADGLLLWLAFCSLVATFAVVIMRPYNLRRCYKKLKRASGDLQADQPIRFSFDDAGVVSAVPGRSEGRFYWSSIQDFAENSSVALLFIGKKRFLFIPKRAMDEAGWQSLKDSLRMNTGIAC